MAIKAFPTMKGMIANMKLYDAEYLLSLGCSNYNGKVMPDGIKRPNRRDYEKYNLKVFTSMMDIGGSYDFLVPDDCEHDHFQSAMINAAFQVFGRRRCVTTRTIGRDPSIIRAIRVQ
jgi:hypothetical protein